MEENKEQAVYNGNAFLRLLKYMKPYVFKMMLVLVMILCLTGLELYRPLIIANVIDTYIEGYDKPYEVKDSADKNTIEYNGIYLSKKISEGADHFYQIMLYEDEYYLFKDLNKNDLDIINDIAYDTYKSSNDQLIIDDYIGTKLQQSDLKLLRTKDIEGIFLNALLYILVLLASFGFNMGQTMMLQYIGQIIIYNVRNEIFEHIHSLPLSFFDTHPVGSVVTRVTNDAETLHQMFSVILVRLFKSAVQIIGIAVVMLSINVKLSLYSFALLPIVVILTYVFKTLSRKFHRATRTKVSALNAFLSENIEGMKIIQIFVREKTKFNEFNEKNKDIYHSYLKIISVNATFRPLIYLVSMISLSVILYYGGIQVIDSTITIGTLYIFINYIGNFYEPIQDLAEQFAALQQALASSEKIFILLDETNPIKETDNPVSLTNMKGKIEFKNVWFAYKEDEYVLRDVSFVINPGEKVAFVGATGAGKTSILSLIGRYYEIQRGQILIDDIDIKDLSISELRRAIGQVQQDVFIFDGNVSDNIRLLDESITQEEIEEAAKIVNADTFISKLPNGYDEKVGEKGSSLSFGQRQLLSFARTIAYKPKILVMDEATANIDTETESLIQDALVKLMNDRTTIMVAHRLSTIQHCDNIIVMHKGKIREMGTHQELLKQNGIYKKLYELQLKEE